MWKAKIIPPIMWPPMLRYNFKTYLQNAGKYVLHILLPRVCFGCGRDLKWNAAVPLCPTCENGLVLPGPLICQRCGVVLKSGGAHCFHCRGSKAEKYKCKIIRSACNFNEFSRGLVHALKYQGAGYVAPYMGGVMAHRFGMLPELAGVNLVIPVPLFPARQKKRGYNQSELLARAFCQKTGLALDVKSLVRVRDTGSQTKLGREARVENMSGAFKVKDPAAVKGKTVLLIDDVATTGSTLEACAQALRLAGAKRVMAYTFAREN